MDLIRSLKLDLSNNNIHQNIIFFSLMLMPAALAAGPVVMEMLIFIVCLSFILLVTIKKINFHIDKKVTVFLLFYLTIVLISSFLSIDSIVSLKSGVLSFRFTIFILASIYLLNVFKPVYKYLFYTYFIIVLFLITDGYVQFFFGKDFFLIPGINSTIITGVFGDEKKLGSFIARMIPILIGLSGILFEKKKTFLLSCSLIFFSIPLLIFTHERVTLIFVLITIIFTAVYFWGVITDNIKLSFSFLFLLIFIPLLVFGLNIRNISSKVENTKIQIMGGGNKIKNVKFWSGQHQAFAETALEIFKKNPIFGSGIKTYRISCQQIRLDYDIINCSTHPHNIFFQLLSETGLAGIFLYLVVLLIISKELLCFFFGKNKRTLSIFFLLSFCFYYNPIFPSGQFFNNWYMGIGTFPLIFYFHNLINKNDN